MGCMLGHLTEPDQKEKVIYYITIEKTCCSLVWASRKLR